MYSPIFFNTSNTIHANRAQFRNATIKRAAFYPMAVFAGYAVMSLIQYQVILAAVTFNPNLFIAFAASSCLTLVLCFALSYLIQKYLAQNSFVYNVSHGLLYAADGITTVYLASLFISSPASVFFLLALVAAGTVPTRAAFALLEKATEMFIKQFYPNQTQTFDPGHGIELAEEERMSNNSFVF